MNYEAISAIAQSVIAIVTLLAFIVAWRKYSVYRNEQEQRVRPFVFLELDRVSSGLYDIVIRNTGLRPACNINIVFDPNIEYGNKTINELQALSNLKFLGPNREIRFFLGSVMGGDTEITKKFHITGKYQDMVTKKTYSIEQVLDPTDELELHQIVQKSIHDMAKSLDTLQKTMEKSRKNEEQILSTLKRGIIIRNSDIKNLSLNDLLTMISSFEYIDEQERRDLWLNPYVYDFNNLLKTARGELLKIEKKSEEESELLQKIDELMKSTRHMGGDGFEENYKQLCKIIRNFGQNTQ